MCDIPRGPRTSLGFGALSGGASSGGACAVGGFIGVVRVQGSGGTAGLEELL